MVQHQVYLVWGRQEEHAIFPRWDLEVGGISGVAMWPFPFPACLSSWAFFCPAWWRLFRKDSGCHKYWGFVWRKLSWEGMNKSLHGSDGHYRVALGKIYLGNNQKSLSIRVAVHGMGGIREKRLTALLLPLMDASSPHYLQAPQLTHWLLLHRRQSLWKHCADLPTDRSLCLLWREENRTRLMGRQSPLGLWGSSILSWPKQSQDLPLRKQGDVNTVGEGRRSSSLQELRRKSWRSKGDHVRLRVGEPSSLSISIAVCLKL